METCCNRRSLTQVICQVIGEYKFREYFRRLKDLGEKARHLLRCSHRDHGGQFIQTTNTKQFIAAAAVSIHEVIEQDYRIISRAMEALYEMAEQGAFQKYSVAFESERFVILLNDSTSTLSKLKSHGEGLLLDPTGRLRQNIMDWDHAEPRTETDYMKGETGIKRRYLQRFGDDLDLILLIYSYYIPCTVVPHMCAQVISKYAAEENIKVIVAYDFVHDWTDEDEAFDDMCTINSYVISLADSNTRVYTQSHCYILDHTSDICYLRNGKHLRKRILKRLHAKDKKE